MKRDTEWRREQFGEFINRCGIEIGLPIDWEKTPRGILGYIPAWPFTRWPFQTDKAIYRVRLAPVRPLTFICGQRFRAIGLPEGTRIQICRKLDSDLGSIPILLQPFYAKDSFPCACIYHDGGYVRAGMWILLPGSAEWRFAPMTRHEVDYMLMLMVGAEGGTAVDRRTIYAAVRTAGGPVWARHKHGR